LAFPTVGCGSDRSNRLWPDCAEGAFPARRAAFIASRTFVEGRRMSASSSSSDRDPLERLAAEFLDRRRGGEPVSPSEYAAKYPQWAEQILEFFPALEVMEGLKPGSGDQTDS